MTDCFVATFYRFASLDDHVVLRDRIEARCQDLGIRGIILLATEGINATVSGTRDSVLALLDFLKTVVPCFPTSSGWMWTIWAGNES